MSVTRRQRCALCRALLPFPSPPSTMLTPWCRLTVQSKVSGLYCPSRIGTRSDLSLGLLTGPRLPHRAARCPRVASDTPSPSETVCRGNVDRTRDPQEVDMRISPIGFIMALTFSALASSLQADAQPAGKIRRIGFLVVSLNCREEFPQTVDKDAPERAMYPGNEAERDRTTVRSSSRHDLSVWPPSLA